MKVLFSLTFASFTSTASRSSPADQFEAAYTYSALHCLRTLNIFSQFSDLCLPLLSLPIHCFSLYLMTPQITICWIKLDLTLFLGIMPYKLVPLFLEGWQSWSKSLFPCPGIEPRHQSTRGLETGSRILWLLPRLEAKMSQGGKNCKIGTQFTIRDTQHSGRTQRNSLFYLSQKQDRSTNPGSTGLLSNEEKHSNSEPGLRSTLMEKCGSPEGGTQLRGDLNQSYRTVLLGLGLRLTSYLVSFFTLGS